MSGYSSGLIAHKIAFELSPIILTNGIADEFPGSAIPIMALTETLNFPFSILSGSQSFDVDSFFAHYQALPGSTLIAQQIGKYPFANSTIAANAIMTVPKNISLIMICPVQKKLGWLEKLTIMEGLKFTLEQHNSAGGTYIIATPSHIYTDCVMLGMHDASAMITKQVQNAYQLDFEQPLLTRTQVDAVLGSLAKIISGGGKVVGSSVFGLASAIATPVSAAVSALIPATAATPAANAVAAGAVSSFPVFGVGSIPAS